MCELRTFEIRALAVVPFIVFLQNLFGYECEEQQETDSEPTLGLSRWFGSPKSLPNPVIGVNPVD
jgi:hypothetical protein